MENTGRLIMAIYGGLMLAGGVIGYVASKSVYSLVAGIASGALLAVAYGLSRTQPKAGFGLAALVAVGLAAVFVKRFLDTQAAGKSPMMALMLILASLAAAVAMGSVWMKATR